MSFEVQELPDIIRVVILIDLSKKTLLSKETLKKRIDKVCVGYACIDMGDLEKALEEMASEGLILYHGDTVQLTDKGVKLGKEWQNLLLKKEPIFEVVAGLVDGSITGLVVIISAFIAGLATKAAMFAAFLTLTAVSITNFSSFLLGGITEDITDMITLQTLMHYSLSDIADGEERSKSLTLLKQLFIVLHKQISRSNLEAAIICGTTTFLAGSIPTIVFIALPEPLDLVLSLSIVTFTIGFFLVRYRARRTKVHWKVTMMETVAIIVVAVLISLLLGEIG
ncbi:MAG: hypothetical protein QHH24_04425 [Candidatus Bathyarchaeota archaeon]|nr:hypothetical protein [Candidatus Bathyarchaeota archaeon]